MHREFFGPERRPQRVDRLVEHGTPLPEVHPECLELLPDMPGAHPEDEASAAEVVEGGVAFTVALI
ncbi:hypothetical protein GCM10010121_073240 [Streptomyces brasiliensis]|uniref:Uncharacterized protein n=1 Tax=Streptomyces brasiliensis TaxID=1954 RepID=A0A917P1D6_9ACTN|nr:hypothetical protein GCM10010121_073240 [Streptomyces brasiliensis]